MPTRAQSTWVCSWRAAQERRVFLLFDRRRNAENEERDRGSDDRLEDHERRNAVDPHHGGGGIADHAPGAAGVGCGDDRREIADVHLGPKELVRHRAADQGRGDVIEKARHNPDQDEQGEGALPFVRQKFRQHDRDVTFLEVPRQKREAGEQAKQIDEDDPLVLDVKKEAGRARPGLETGEDDLVERDRRQTR